MTANDTSPQQEEAMNSLEKAIVGVRNQGTVDFAVFDQWMRVFLHDFEECSENSVVIPSRCEGSHSPSISNDRPACAIGDVAVQKPPLLTFGTSNGTISSLVSLSFSFPAGWPWP